MSDDIHECYKEVPVWRNVLGAIAILFLLAVVPSYLIFGERAALGMAVVGVASLVFMVLKPL